MTNNGFVTSTTLYHPWGVGNVRSISACAYQSGTLPTDKTYSGQRSHTDPFGLYFYNARWYDPDKKYDLCEII